MSDLNQTGDFTGNTPVNPAPASNPATPVTINFPYTPQQPPTQTAPAPTTDALANYEQRVRALMSEKDRALNQYERAVQERATLQQQLDQLQQNHKATLEGSATALEQALNRAREHEIELAKQRAVNLKLKKAVENPEIAAYINALPEVLDENDLNTRIDAIKAAREADLAKAREALAAAQPQTPAQPAQQPPANDPYARLRALYPDGNVPPATPARPATTAVGSNSTQSMEQQLKLALDHANRSGDYTEYERIFAEMTQVAEAQTRAQFGL